VHTYRWQYNYPELYVRALINPFSCFVNVVSKVNVTSCDVLESSVAKYADLYNAKPKRAFLNLQACAQQKGIERGKKRYKTKDVA
jgi:hypothetical protein